MLMVLQVIFLYTGYMALIVFSTWVIFKYAIKVFKLEKWLIDYMMNRKDYETWRKDKAVNKDE